jgi:tRNA G18 (ribose-2'-O)-methylase SpoU
LFIILIFIKLIILFLIYNIALNLYRPIENSNIDSKTHPIVIVLDNLRSAFNVGSIYRTADAGGIKELITVGITPHIPNPKLRKTAMQSLETVPTRHFDNIIDCINNLKKGL